MWETRHSTVGMGYFKTKTLHATLRIQSQPQEVSCVFFGKKNIRSSQLDVQETNNQFLIAPQSLKLFLWMLDYGWMVYLLLTYGNFVIEVLRTTKDNIQPGHTQGILGRSNPTIPAQGKLEYVQPNWVNEYNRKKS